MHLTDDHPIASISDLPSLPSLVALHAGEMVRAVVRAGWIVVMLVSVPGLAS